MKAISRAAGASLVVRGVATYMAWQREPQKPPGPRAGGRKQTYMMEKRRSWLINEGIFVFRLSPCIYSCVWPTRGDIVV